MSQFGLTQYLKNQALSASTDFAGGWILLTGLTGIAINAGWTGGALTGTLKVQTTNDPNNLTDIPPLDYPNSVYAVSGPGYWGWDITELHSGYCRLYYTHTSGTGAINANYVAKGPFTGPPGWGPTL